MLWWVARLVSWVSLNAFKSWNKEVFVVKRPSPFFTFSSYLISSSVFTGSYIDISTLLFEAADADMAKLVSSIDFSPSGNLSM